MPGVKHSKTDDVKHAKHQERMAQRVPMRHHLWCGVAKPEDEESTKEADH